MRRDAPPCRWPLPAPKRGKGQLPVERIPSWHVGHGQSAVYGVVFWEFGHKIEVMKWILPLTIGSACCALTFLAGMVTADLHRPPATPDTSYAETVQASHQAELERAQHTLQKLRTELDAAQKVASADATIADKGFDDFVKAASQNERTYRENIASLTKDRDDWQTIATKWQTAAQAFEARAEENYASAMSWKVAYESRTPAAYTPPTPTPRPRATTLDTLAQEQRRLEQDYARFNGAAKQPTQIIQTGYGTATIINPDGTTSFYQSTGEGTGLITTP